MNIVSLASLIVLPLIAFDAMAFCGFYVAKADTKLFNKASQVAIARDGDRTVLTMSNDYQGEPKDFAMVIPVPQVLEREQIHVTERKYVEHLDAYTAPRLVEYFDEDPCARMLKMESQRMLNAPASAMSTEARDRAQSSGVTIEAAYTVGEYDILILSAVQSGGLLTWLKENEYRIPPGAEAIVGSYIKQNLKFFLAKVNLSEQSKLGFGYLRPLQVAYESPRFMLPIRLGTVNANGTQELFIYTLTRNGRVETTNYRTVRLPTDSEIPSFVKQEFGKFYAAMFERATEREQRSVVFLEYAWDMGWCDPCAADPLTPEELRELGVFWRHPNSGQPVNMRQVIAPNPIADVFVTRLHLRYDAEHFPEDLMFQETGDRQNFQGRYVIRNAWTGHASCPEAERYFNETLPARLKSELDNLASLTGWDRTELQKRVKLPEHKTVPWWKDLWSNE